MTQKHIRILGACVAIALWAALTAFSWLTPPKDYSFTERAPLAQMPEITADAIAEGSFMSDFEEFTLDQFPLRDTFRSIKAVFHLYGLNQADNNGLFLQDGYLEKMDKTLSVDGTDRAVVTFDRFYTNFLKGKTDRIYMTLIPAKGQYMDHPALDMTQMEEILSRPYAQYVDIGDALSLEDYYYTDTHWRQERIGPVADKLLSAMGNAPAADYTPKALDIPFYGVYYGQAGLPLKPETMYVMESDALAGCTVTSYRNGPSAPEAIGLYDLVGAEEMADPYNVFLHGSEHSYVVIDNPNATTDKELILLRDSFGCSLAPLLVESYKKVTVIDLRVVGTMAMKLMESKELLNTENADVLFAYSAMVVNNPDSFQTG